MVVMATPRQFHVLAVDDSLIDRKLIEMLLKTSSYQVTAVDSGRKALELLGLNGDDDEEEECSLSDGSDDSTPSVSSSNCREMDVNLIITDYFMPGMTGYDLLRKIKVTYMHFSARACSSDHVDRIFNSPLSRCCCLQGSKSYRDVPVVIMSSENVPSRIARCLEEGAEEFFLKPVQLSDVKKLRPHLMERKRSDQGRS
ncbi:hypothetical protein SAY87_015546 [Trapa incisa]|uniref:Response regulatory domain-containing protein n=1 Tax=Trapa incisa TaxID=236973 RepID=A0AAN7JM07_9MYRT|nr:hypothetical protein SAY87_015546 [Trapa incisa]